MIKITDNLSVGTLPFYTYRESHNAHATIYKNSVKRVTTILNKGYAIVK